MAWELVYGLGGLALLAAIVWAFVRYKTRNRANDAISEQAAKELRDDPEHYEAKRAELERKLEPE